MKASELRLGNLIMTDGQAKKVIVLHGDNIITELDNSTFPPQLQPIPLTEEWLIKFGFELEEHTKLGNGADWQPEYPRSDYRDFILGEFIVRYDTFTYLSKEDKTGELIVCEPEISIHTGQWTERICEPVRCPKIEYVHQLQNLFYALHGEELTIKE